MTTRYCNHGQSTGTNDGTSWENAYQTLSAGLTWLNGASNGDELWIKEHAGISSPGTISVSSLRSAFYGFDSSLTGTDGDKATRTGYTVISDVFFCVLAGYMDRIYFTGTNTNLSNIFVNSGGQFVSSKLKTTRTQDGTIIYLNSPNGFTLDDLVFENGVGYNGRVIYGTTASNGTIKNILFDSIDHSSEIAMFSLSGTSTISNLVIENIKYKNCVKSASGGGTAFLYFNGNNSVIRNMVFENCECDTVTAYMARLNAGVSLSGCTIGGCTCSSDIILYGSGVTIANAICWGNTADGYVINGSGAGSLTYSMIQSDDYASGLNGSGMVSSVDPAFLGTGSDPYELSSSTPSSISTGGSVSASGYADYDILGVDRDNSTPSMGAYEYVSTGGGTEHTSDPDTFSNTQTFVDVTVSKSLNSNPSEYSNSQSLTDVARNYNHNSYPSIYDNQISLVDISPKIGIASILIPFDNINTSIGVSCANTLSCAPNPELFVFGFQGVPVMANFASTPYPIFEYVTFGSVDSSGQASLTCDIDETITINNTFPGLAGRLHVNIGGEIAASNTIHITIGRLSTIRNSIVASNSMPTFVGRLHTDVGGAITLSGGFVLSPRRGFNNGTMARLWRRR